MRNLLHRCVAVVMLACVTAGTVAGQIEVIRAQALKGNTNAQITLGNTYRDGVGVTQDFAEAVKWYRMAADQGESTAQLNLAHIYDKGQGVPQDYSEAAKWYRMAAEQGVAQAQVGLGYMYYAGHGVQQDYPESVRWIRMAAEQGNPHAQQMLGTILGADLEGLVQDYVQAHVWLNLAATSAQDQDTQDSAKDRRQQLALKMTTEQISEAQRLAREWMPKTWEQVRKESEAQNDRQVRAQEQSNPYVQSGKIGREATKTGIVALPEGASKDGLLALVGKGVLLMPSRNPDPPCPGFEIDGEDVTEPCGGKIGVIRRIGEDWRPTVVVEIDGREYTAKANGGTEADPRVTGLIALEDLDRARADYEGKMMYITPGLSSLYTYDPETDEIGSVEVQPGLEVTVKSVVSSWAVNTQTPVRLIVEASNGAQGFVDIDPSDPFGISFDPTDRGRSEERTAPESEVSIPVNDGWERVAIWKGLGIKNTEDFVITSDQWRIVWGASPTSDAGSVLQVFVYSGETLAGLAANIANQAGQVKDISYHRTKGVHHLQISSANMAWIVIVEQRSP